MRFILFDIDGTLLRSGGAARGALEQSLEESFGTSGDPAFVFDGKTDRQIIRELMTGAGIDPAEIDAKLSSALDGYLARLADAIHKEPGRVRLLPGVRELLEKLSGIDSVVLGLLTGNIEQGAQLKLRAAGVDFHTFKVNAFGSDHHHRPSLAGIARARALEFPGSTANDVYVVVGDTPHDIDCGKAIGAVTVGVASGGYSVADLKAAHADIVFPDLTDTDAILRSLLTSKPYLSDNG